MAELLRSPFFVVNPKSYLYGEEEYKLAAVAEELAVQYDVDILFTGQLVDLARLAHDFPHLVICAQNMEALRPGKGMGHILPEALKAAGVRATFLNHAENPKTVSDLTDTIARAKELGIATVVCADDIADAKAIAQLEPDVMVCELKSLIGTGKSADETTAENCCKLVRDTVKALYDEATGEAVRIQYGGSVKPTNIKSYMACEDIDGALIGGASLKVDSFKEIIDATK